MRPPLIITGLLFLALFGTCWSSIYWLEKHTYEKAPSEIFATIYSINIAIDKLLYGDNSLFQARDESGLALFEYCKGNSDQAKTLLQHALNTRRALSPRYSEVVYRSLRHNSMYNQYTGTGDSRPLLEEALDQALHEHYRGGGDSNVTDSFISLGQLEYELGNYADAEHYFRCAVDWNRLQAHAEELREHEDYARTYRTDEAAALMDLAELYLDFGMEKQASECFTQAKQLFSKADETIIQRSALEASRVARLQRNYKEAEKYLDDLENYSDSIHQRWWAEIYRSQIYREQRQYDKATAILNKIANQIAASHLPRTPAIEDAVDISRARVELDQHHYDAGRKLLEHCLPSITKRAPNGLDAYEARHLLASAQAKKGADTSGIAPRHLLSDCWEQRAKRLSGAQIAVPPSAVPKGAIGISTVTIEPFSKIDIYRDAVDHFQSNLDKRKTTIELANALIDYADALSAIGDTQTASARYKEAVGIFQKEKRFTPRYLHAVCQYVTSLGSSEDSEKILDDARRHVKIQTPSDKLVLAEYLLARAGMPDVAYDTEECEKLTKQALEIHRLQLGLNNPITANTMIRAGTVRRNAAGQALQTRGRNIMIQLYIDAVKNYGPLSQQAEQTYSDCVRLNVPGFAHTYPIELAVQELVYGADSPPTTQAMLAEADALWNSTPPAKARQPYWIAIGFMLFFIFGFGELYAFVQSADANNADRPPFTMRKRWKIVKTIMPMACIGLMAWGGIQLWGLDPKTRDWRVHKQYALASQAVANLRKYKPDSEQLADASLALANYCNGEHKATKKECLRQAIDIFERKMQPQWHSRYRYTTAYKDLAEILRDENRQEEAKELEDKSFQLSRWNGNSSDEDDCEKENSEKDNDSDSENSQERHGDG